MLGMILSLQLSITACPASITRLFPSRSESTCVCAYVRARVGGDALYAPTGFVRVPVPLLTQTCARIGVYRSLLVRSHPLSL